MSGTAPVRVVLFYGPHLRSAHEFALRLHEHPEVELARCFCEAPGESDADYLEDLRRRRGWLAWPMFAVHLVRSRFGRGPDGTPNRARDRRWREFAGTGVRYVDDLHAPEILREVRRLDPDLGLSYGGPILRPELFALPRLGTLGIHHGKLPEYRGKKTTFWEIWEGEPSAGVTIQRIERGIDTGQIVARAEVPVGKRGYERVWQDVQRRGIRLFLDAVLAVGKGSASASTAPGTPGPLRGDPGALELLGLPLRRLLRRLPRPRRAGGRGREDDG